MPPVKILTDQNELVETKQYPDFASFPFEKFNPVQSRIFEIFDKDANAIIAAATSAGKTVCAEMFMSQEVRQRGGKAMYLAPLKALAKEKIDDWTNDNHHFKDVNLSICTGDYRLTEARKKELEDSNIILMTSEMLNSRCRNFEAEANNWLKDVGTIVVDESHLLTVPGRGDHLEVGLMKFSQIAPNCRIIFLSATMPNVQEIAEWISYVLTGKETYLINSTYRPCPLGIHWEEYEEEGSYAMTEQSKVATAMQIIEDIPDDKFLFFVHSIDTGHMMKKALEEAGIACEFHYSGLEKADRHKLEEKFKTGKLRALVATSTLAWGLNMPARRVVILGVHRGVTEVETYDIWQMAGRAGRVGYDPRGDVYILLPSRKFEYHQKRISTPAKITSKLLEYIGEPNNPHYKTLAFHLVSEIHHGQIRTKDDVHKWSKRSLATFQVGDLSEAICDRTLDLLMKVGVIKEVEGVYEVTSVGKVASMFYYSPFDVADLRRNFRFLFQNNQQGNDISLAMALGNVDTIRMNFVSRAERDEMSGFAAKVKLKYGDVYTDSAIKGGYVYFCLMNGLNRGPFASFGRTLQLDFPRTEVVLNALDSLAAKWNQRGFFRTLGQRINYGVGTELLDLCRIPNIAKVRAEKLYAAGFRTAQDVAARPEDVKRILNMKDAKIQEIVKAASELD
jgi:replicative superfamily II helicase